MNKNEVKARLQELEEKYFDLVWYARAAGSNNPLSLPSLTHIEMSLPNECKLLEGKDSSWHHGFNSGCLAAFRLVLGLMSNKSEAELAEESFPFLDT